MKCSSIKEEFFDIGGRGMTNRKIPEHIAIIMDGNGRWAKQRLLPRNEGHRRGIKTLEKIIDYAERIGVKYLTVYAFSTENWNRSKEEVNGLMSLFERYLDNNIKNEAKDCSRFHVIGDLESDVISTSVKQKIVKLEEMTKDKSGIYFNMAFNYGGRDELVRAIKKIGKAIENKKLSALDINEALISDYLDTKDIPDPELMIRTSGEERTSNFLPWQLTYTEFYFASCLWPDFSTKEFDAAIDEFNRRQRRFGSSE